MAKRASTTTGADKGSGRKLAAGEAKKAAKAKAEADAKAGKKPDTPAPDSPPMPAVGMMAGVVPGSGGDQPGTEPLPVTVFGRYVKVLLSSNEFLFIR